MLAALLAQRNMFADQRHQVGGLEYTVAVTLHARNEDALEGRRRVRACTNADDLLRTDTPTNDTKGKPLATDAHAAAADTGWTILPSSMAENARGSSAVRQMPRSARSERCQRGRQWLLAS